MKALSAKPAEGDQTPIFTPQIGAACRWAIGRLCDITRQPRLEAELLLSHVIAMPRTYLIAYPETPLTTAQVALYSEAVERRTQNVPLPYITGAVPFYDLAFNVNESVLIPRPETELLVEVALEWLRARPQAILVDVGTGSGCIAVTLAHHAPQTRVYAIDISESALAVARANAERLIKEPHIIFLSGDLLTPLPETVNLIVSNPPYIAESEWDELPPSVCQEPRKALIAGPDGLQKIRKLLTQAKDKLRPAGAVLVEIGERQGNAARALAQTAFPEASVDILMDLAGKERLLKIIT